jgi:hypothetical protein
MAISFDVPFDRDNFKLWNVTDTIVVGWLGSGLGFVISDYHVFVVTDKVNNDDTHDSPPKTHN